MRRVRSATRIRSIQIKYYRHRPSTDSDARKIKKNMGKRKGPFPSQRLQDWAVFALGDAPCKFTVLRFLRGTKCGLPRTQTQPDPDPGKKKGVTLAPA